jgi:uncharacterized membrane protein
VNETPSSIRLSTMPAAWWLPALSLLWSGAVPAAAAGASIAGGPWASIVAIVYGIGHVVCHQRPERSFAWGDAAWPVCARCSGIYFGATVGAMLGLLAPLALVATPARVRRWLLMSSIPVALTLAYEWSTGQVPTNAVRAVSGGVVGMMVAWLLVSFISEPQGRRSGSAGNARA